MTRSRFVGLLLLLLLTPAVIAGAVMLRAHRLLGDPGTLAKGFSVGLGRGLTFESIDVALWPPGIVIRGVEVADRSKYGSGELGHVDAIWLQAGIPALIRGVVRIEEVVLEKPTLRVVLGLEGWNLGLGEQDLETPEAFAVRRVSVTGLRVVYRDRTRPGVAEFEIRNANLNATRTNLEEGWTIDLAGTTDGILDPDGLPGVLTAQVRTPASDEELLRLEVSVEGLNGERVDELAQLIGGDMPFGSYLVGALSGRVTGTIVVGGEQPGAQLEAELDMGQAELRTREGWVLKPQGLPAQLRMVGFRGPGGLQMDLFDGEVGTLRVEARRLGGEDGLALEGSGLDGRGLESMLPLLAGIRPRGKLDLSGVVRNTPKGSQLNLILKGTDLTLLPEEDRWTLGGFSLALGVASDGDYALAVQLQQLAGQAVAVDALAVGYLARGDAAPLVDAHASGLQRNGSSADDLWLRGRFREGTLSDAEIFGRAFGGRSTGTGTLRLVDAVWQGRLQTQWDGLAIAGLETFLGSSTGLTGILSGRSELTASGRGWEGFGESLAGPVSFHVVDTRFTEIDPLVLGETAIGHLPLVGPPLKRRLEKAGRQMDRSGSNRLVLDGAGRWEPQGLQLDSFQIAGPLYGFSGKGSLSKQGVIDLRGDLNLRSRLADQLRQDDARVRAVLGDSGPIVLPVLVQGSYPELTARPGMKFQKELAQRALRRGRWLGGGLRQQLREAVAP